MMRKYVRFSCEGKLHIGLVSGDSVQAITDTRWADLDAIVASGDVSTVVADGQSFALGSVVLLPPLARPGKIICVGVNFPDRNEEYKDGNAAPSNPSLFIRFPSSFTGHSQPLIRPPESHQLDYEGEIAIIIGKPGRRIPEVTALDHIAALTLCNEGTLRDWVRHAKFNVTQGKNFERSGSMGPWLIPYTDEKQIADIRLTTRVNGALRQDDRSSRMIFSFRKIISYISTFTTLEPCDIIVTGTPTGAGARLDPPQWLKPGDVVEVEAEGLGILRNSIEDEA
jgi:2-keto-4-pentenoate hydratase/2-oxohepta-3-ene-1,7-dioic acid hydratase in catechol pathway